MSTRPAFRTLAGALILSLLAGAPALAQTAHPAPQPPMAEVTLSLDQARAVAATALQQGDAALALQIGQGLLQADATDPLAHFIIAQALRQQGHPREARKAAALAYRHARTDIQKFEAAQLAARLSVDTKAFTRAQLWLRRSLLHAPDPAMRPRIAQDFRQVRAMDPLEFRLRLSLAPSSNVNNGSDSPYALIDGVPVIGLLDGLSQALSGVTGTADLSLGYRLNGTQASETRALLRAYGSRVWLDDSARALANSFPGADVSNDDFSFALIEAGLRHVQRTGAGADGGFVAIEGAAGRSWYGGDPYQRHVRLGLTQGIRLSDTTTLSLGAEAERRSFAQGFNQPIDTLGLQASLGYRIANGDRISLSVAWRDSDSDSRNAVSTRRTAYLRYDMAQPMGPARLGFTLGAARTHYPDYAVGFIAVPGGRQDDTVFGSIDILFQDLDYAGFAPTLTLRAQKTRSNFSRFDASELAVSLGIRSLF
ncbi:MAG: surface lipoprotein assembly modifier [Rhodobacterales bacterium]|nr:surface lipoprotein assembly modifier [Rhodobacterales bacterium]MDX5391870.1 surface lipoprotein assembly modifier [Rhodobacterales bacterium]MDX5491570.1 surface lipoprotein assembly modifier [Rhodobacterales bacterium]